MSILKANVDLAISIFRARIGDGYVFGGAFSPTDVKQGTDCSGMCDTILQALVNGAGMQWGRHVSTESWPYNYPDDLAVAVGTAGPYGTICAGDAQPGPPPTQYPPQIPSDAAAIIYLMHGGGGENSHMMIAVNDGTGNYIVMETGGDHDDTGGNGPYASPNGPATSTTDPEWTDIWYLPGPVEGATPPPSVMTVPLVQNANGTWTSPNPAWAHLIQRESSGNPTIIQQIIDANSGGNEAEGLFQITPKTWNAHGGQEFAPSPRLATPQQQAIVAARIFTANPSGSDWGAGLPGREDANQLAAGLVPTTQPSGDDMAAVPQEQWDELFREICGQASSQSPFRALNEGAIWRPSQMWLNDDGMTHPQYVEWAASRGDQTSLARLHELATADATKYPGRGADIVLAQQVLDRLSSKPVPNAAPVAPTPAPVPAPAAPPNGSNSISPSGWVGIAGVVFQALLWLLQQSMSLLPPQWAAGASGLLALLTALGIYKAPDHTATSTPVIVDPPPPPPPAPTAPPVTAGSISDVLARTQNDADELANKINQINTSLG